MAQTLILVSSYFKLHVINPSQLLLLHKAELLLAEFLHIVIDAAPHGVFASNAERAGYVVVLLVRSNGPEAGALHVLLPHGHPVGGVCKGKWD